MSNIQQQSFPFFFFVLCFYCRTIYDWSTCTTHFIHTRILSRYIYIIIYIFFTNFLSFLLIFNLARVYVELYIHIYYCESVIYYIYISIIIIYNIYIYCTCARHVMILHTKSIDATTFFQIFLSFHERCTSEIEFLAIRIHIDQYKIITKKKTAFDKTNVA